MKWLLLASVTAAVAVANVLMRAAARRSADLPPHAGVATSLLDPRVLAALATLGLGFVLYNLALRRIDLAVAYPLMAGGSLLLVTAASYLFLGETPTPTRLLGAACVVAGVVLLAR